MKHDHHAVGGDCRCEARNRGVTGSLGNWLRRWFLLNSMLSGVFALLWLLLRAGNKPSRFAYPCQQAAFGTATAAFGAPLVATILMARRGLAAAIATPRGRLLAICGLVATLGFGAWAISPRPVGYRPGPHASPPRGYEARLYHITDCPQNPVGDHFIGLDNVIALMGMDGLKFYKSATEGFESGPDGIIDRKDVVVIKINYQWDERGGTNTDVLRGLIRRIVDHPDTFAGEIVVCENSQFNPISGFDYANNNAQDHSLSPHDVVVGFQTQGYTVSHFSWTDIRYSSVDEYSEGSTTDGYIVYPYDGQLHGSISYPKFQTSYGTYISLKYGVWIPLGTGGGRYDRERLKFINVPVLKSHHATYGATACIKHYMGVVTRELDTSSHSAIGYGVLGALLGEIQLADLNILDCIWINADPNDGPWTSYGAATRRDELIASVDPVAADIWAVKNILIPAFIENGHSPPWPYPSADPDNPSSPFRVYLDNSMDYILAAGYDVTNDLETINTLTWNGVHGDFDGSGEVDTADIGPFIDVLLEFNTTPFDMFLADMDEDRDADGNDIALFVTAVLTGP